MRGDFLKSKVSLFWILKICLQNIHNISKIERNRFGIFPKFGSSFVYWMFLRKILQSIITDNACNIFFCINLHVKVAIEYHDFLMFSAVIFNILTKKRPLFILTERHGSGYYTTNGRLPPRRTTVAAHKGIKHMP